MTRTDGAPANAIDLPALTADAGRHGDGRPVSVAIVAASWYGEIMDGLIGGAIRACADAGITPDLVRVPGSFELPLGTQAALRDHDAAVALGVVVRGGTPHFDYVCDAATAGLTRVGLDAGKPVGFGLLTCASVEQARDRAGLPGSAKDHGYEAAVAALRMVVVTEGRG
ncbi:6,7-dimethyl-8-ribityllumazine synthase [uncultured Propionibacterium sp.]|uniref:6,7-dimethyl-8-ribityllumazine synthase n=1 Tax=uncultured Propionibacterium sp. TaxID=218066 RepID=UPI0029300D75|nr:6,7-dimethyl-8-ribityllumazine synthase [uncultured Propionibacterium sp.]